MSSSPTFVGQSRTPVALVSSRRPNSSVEAATLDGVGKTPSPVDGTTNNAVSKTRDIVNYILQEGEMVNDDIRYSPLILSAEDQATLDKENAEDEAQ